MIRPPWKSQEFLDKLNIEKGLETGLETVHNNLNYGTNASKARKFDSLLGLEPIVEKGEIVLDDKPLREKTELEKWEERRQRALERSNENATIALKRDEGAWTDEDGYGQLKEVPKFREGFNNTEFIKPLVPDHLHNGTKLFPDRTNGVQTDIFRGGVIKSETKVTTTNRKPTLEFPQNSFRAQYETLKSISAKDSVHRSVSKRADLAVAVGSYFMKGIESGIISGRNEILEKTNKTETLSKAIGNAFVNLGMTLPQGTGEESKRNDSVALKLGSMIMNQEFIGAYKMPQIEESSRKEVAIALGRAMLHLRQAANIEASRSNIKPINDHQLKNNLKVSIGKLTMQLIENSALRSGEKVFINPSSKKEVLTKSMNSISLEMGQKTLKSIARRNKNNSTEVNRPMLPGLDSAPSIIPRKNPINDRS